MPTHLCSNTCCYVEQAPKKQCEDRHAPLLLLYRQVHDKRGIAESLLAKLARARLTACEMGVFLREISQLSKICPPPSFRSHLSSSPMGIFSRDYCTVYLLDNDLLYRLVVEQTLWSITKCNRLIDYLTH